MEPVRVAVAGAGYWGPKLIRNVFTSPSTTLVAVCDRDPVRAERVARQYPGVACTTDFARLLELPGLEAVCLATPVATHHPLAMAALEAGKHVMVEKPLASTVAEGEELVRVARRRGLRLMCDHVFCFHPAVRKIREVVARGDLGDLLYFDSVRVNLGLFQNDVNVFYDLAPHDLSILDFVLTGGPRPVAVSATGVDPVGTGLASIGYISVFFDTGMLGHVHVNWLSPVKVRMTLVGGSKKMIVWNDIDASEKVKIYDKGVEVDQTQRDRILYSYRHGEATIPVLDEAEPLGLAVQDFATAIREGRDPSTDGEQGLRVLRILAAADLSYRRGGARIELGTSAGGAS